MARIGKKVAAAKRKRKAVGKPKPPVTPCDPAPNPPIPLTGNEKLPPSQIDLVTWAMRISGYTNTEICEELGCHTNSVTNRCKRVEDYIGSKFDLDQMRMGLHRLFPTWLRSLSANLEKGDVPTTIAHGKGMGYYVEKTIDEKPFIGEDDAKLVRDILAILQPAANQTTGSANESAGAKPKKG